MSGPALRIGVSCFVLGATLAVGAGVAQDRANDALTARRLEALAAQVAGDVATRMRSFEFGLRGMRGVAVAQGGLPTLAQVRRYAASRDVEAEFPGARGFGLVWRVAAQDEAAFVARMRADGRPEFAVRSMAPHAGERFVIGFVEPQERNAAAVGIDIASEPRRRAAALAAQASGRAAITEPITLVQASGQAMRSFLLLLPLPLASMRGARADEGAAVAGWSYAPVVIDDVLATLPLHEDKVWIALRDADGAVDATFYASAGAEPDGAGLPATEVRIAMFDRQWVAHVRARPALGEDARPVSPWFVAAVGLLVAALLGIVAFQLVQARRHGRALHRERAHYAALVDASDDGIVGLRADGAIGAWNPGAERLFGFAAADVLGRPLGEVLPAPPWADEETVLAASAGAGRRVTPFETQRRHRDGRVVDVSACASPIAGAGGRPAGLVLVFRDIRAARAAKRDLDALNRCLDRQVRERDDELDRALGDLHEMADGLPSMVGYWDRSLENRMASRAYAARLGVDPQRLKGRHMREAMPEEAYAQSRAHADAALRGEARTFRLALAHGGPASGTLAHYLPDVAHGVVQGFYVLLHDEPDRHVRRLAHEAGQRDDAARRPVAPDGPGREDEAHMEDGSCRG